MFSMHTQGKACPVVFISRVNGMKGLKCVLLLGQHVLKYLCDLRELKDTAT